MVDRRAPMVKFTPPTMHNMSDWLPYKTNKLHFLEPREYECMVVMHVVASGMTPVALGLNMECFRATWPPSYMTFKQLNSILEHTCGPAAAFLWMRTAITGADLFLAPEGTFGISCRWIHPDNRTDDHSTPAFDPDSNYKHAAVWMADRRMLYWTDVVVAAPEDLSNIESWLHYVYVEHGLQFSMKAGRVFQLMVNTHSRWFSSTEYFAKEELLC